MPDAMNSEHCGVHALFDKRGVEQRRNIKIV